MDLGERFELPEWGNANAFSAYSRPDNASRIKFLISSQVQQYKLLIQ